VLALFSKKRPAEPPDTSAIARVIVLEAEMKGMRAEWENAYELIMRALRRLNKRARDLAAKEENDEEPVGATNSLPPGIDPISAQILARRHRVPPRIDGSAG